MTTTNNNLGGVLIGDAEYQDDTLVFAGAATVAEGTILARDSVSLKLVIFVKGGATNENGIPKVILTYDVTATGAGDEQVRAAIRGDFNATRLIIDADGDASSVDAAVLDQLRSYGLVAVDVQELNIQDNQ